MECVCTYVCAYVRMCGSVCLGRMMYKVCVYVCCLFYRSCCIYFSSIEEKKEWKLEDIMGKLTGSQ